jgi:hypothetical protein
VPKYQNIFKITLWILFLVVYSITVEVYICNCPDLRSFFEEPELTRRIADTRTRFRSRGYNSLHPSVRLRFGGSHQGGALILLFPLSFNLMRQGGCHQIWKIASFSALGFWMWIDIIIYTIVTIAFRSALFTLHLLDPRHQLILFFGQLSHIRRSHPQ